MVKLWLQPLIIHGHNKRCVYLCGSRAQLSRGLKRRSAAARLVRLWVRIPLGPWMYTVGNVVCCRYRFLRRVDHSSRGIPPTVVGFVCDLEKPQARGGLGPRWPTTPQLGGKGETLRLFTAPVWKRKEFFLQWYAAMKWRKKFRFINLCDTMITLFITLKIPGIAVWLFVKLIQSWVTKLYGPQHPTARERRSFLRR